MAEAKFILSKKKLLSQVKILKDLGLNISYSYKTNKEVGNVLQDFEGVDFSIHAKEEIEMIKDKSRIWFFTQAESEWELKEILNKRIRNFVVDNEIDLERLLKVVNEINLQSFLDSCSGASLNPEEVSIQNCIKINLSLRMKFQEHRIGTGKYFVYGMSVDKVNEIIKNFNCDFVNKLGIHVHRKSQNTSEWEIVSELKDSLSRDSLEKIQFVNLGGGLPTEYRSFNSNVMPYIFEKLKKTKEFLDKLGIETYIEPGRFLASPCIKLEVEIIQIQGKNIVINTTIYNCALDTVLTGTKMLVEGELDKGDFYLIKGNSPTRDDIFRYKVGLSNPKIGNKVVFLNAGAYNYTTDFFGYKKLRTEIFD